MGFWEGHIGIGYGGASGVVNTSSLVILKQSNSFTHQNFALYTI